MAVHILGIRHHGVGSAKQVQLALDRINPDLILVEGPPEIGEIFGHVGHPDLQPPVAIMVYNITNPKESSFYPFAEYSPEWVAIRHANQQQIPVRAIDMPARTSFIRQQTKTDQADVQEGTPSPILQEDPMTVIAQSAGFETGEDFWEYHFEHRSQQDHDHFESVMHLMESLRAEGLQSSMDEENEFREAYMRSQIQEAINEMYENIVVVCGAWHAPALVDLKGQQKSDLKTLKKLPRSKAKIGCTWIPWTNDRLSMQSGYGAGIFSPGWYAHLWHAREDAEIHWLSHVAGLFRQKGMDMSTAHVIEAFRLARSLATLRNKYFVSLQEMNDAVLSVMCMGDALLLSLVKTHLIIGNQMGQVPEDIPKMPLQEDFEITIKKLRLRLSAAPKQYDLDLRKDIDLQRSILFHRLMILDIRWVERTYSRTKGTFKESWAAQWSPEMMIHLIDKAYLGNTVSLAAQTVVVNRCKETQKVDEVADLIQKSLPAGLFEELDFLLAKINELSSISSDLLDLMRALPQLIDVARYGDVRKSDLNVLNEIVHQLLIKVNVGLPNAAYGLDEVNSFEMFDQISKLNHALKIYAHPPEEEQWHLTLRKILEKEGINAVITGCVSRLLLDAQQFSEAEAEQHVSYALSASNDPITVAGWLEGFLKGSGTILIYDHRLWNLIYQWVAALSQETFMELVPMLRRTFSKFEYGERKQIGEKAKKGIVNEEQKNTTPDSKNFDQELAASILPTINYFLQPSTNVIHDESFE